MLYFGIDWSQDHHNLCILNEAGARMSQIQFEHSPTGFAQIEQERRKLDVPVPDCPLIRCTSVACCPGRHEGLARKAASDMIALLNFIQLYLKVYRIILPMLR